MSTVPPATPQNLAPFEGASRDLGEGRVGARRLLRPGLRFLRLHFHGTCGEGGFAVCLFQAMLIIRESEWSYASKKECKNQKWQSPRRGKWRDARHRSRVMGVCRQDARASGRGGVEERGAW